MEREGQEGGGRLRRSRGAATSTSSINSTTSSSSSARLRLVAVALLAAAAATTASAFVVRVPGGAASSLSWVGARSRIGGGGAAAAATAAEGPSSSSLVRPRAPGFGVALAAEGKAGGGGGSSSKGGKKGGGSKPGASAQGGNQRRRRQDALDGMKLGQRFEMGYDIEPEVVPLEEDDTLPWVETIAAAADARKGEEVYAIRVSSLTTVSSFFVLVSGNSRPQIQAIAAAIEEDMVERHGVEPRNGGEGTADSGWILLDYGSVVVNVMTPVARQYYALEKLWRKGEEVDLSHILKPNAPPGSVTSSSASSAPALEGGEPLPSSAMQDGMDKENDPFWS